MIAIKSIRTVVHLQSGWHLQCDRRREGGWWTREAFCHEFPVMQWVGKFTQFGAKGRRKVWDGGTAQKHPNTLPFLQSSKIKEGSGKTQFCLKERQEKWHNTADYLFIVICRRAHGHSSFAERVFLLVVACSLQTNIRHQDKRLPTDGTDLSCCDVWHADHHKSDATKRSTCADVFRWDVGRMKKRI